MKEQSYSFAAGNFLLFLYEKFPDFEDPYFRYFVSVTFKLGHFTNCKMPFPEVVKYLCELAVIKVKNPWN